jgi:catechol 2,3-dioxygenase-like lactoylglutathione lyase family enzyme
MALGTINHISLTVGDLATAERFYDPLLRFLGYRLSERREDYLEWSGPGGWFILRPARNPIPHDRYARGLHHLAWNADSRAEVDRFHALLVAQRAQVLDGPAEFPQHGKGYYAVFFEDPDGIKLELAHTP